VGHTLKPIGQKAVNLSFITRRHAIGALSSLALHSLLFSPVLFGGVRHKATDPERGYARPEKEPNNSEQSALMLVQVPDPELDDQRSFLSSNDIVLASVSMPEAAPPSASLLDDTDDEPGDSDASAIESTRAQMVGRYVGQINARILRAWVRPRIPLETGMFACQVKVSQERDGHVREIELMRCNGDGAWQTSLVNAIQSASPLPAPPDPKVFATTVVLELTSATYSPGEVSEGFASQ
jgi:hypothetical protein